MNSLEGLLSIDGLSVDNFTENVNALKLEQHKAESNTRRSKTDDNFS